MFLIIFYVYILIFLNNVDSKTKQDKFTNK